jgi:hypothetical protein
LRLELPIAVLQLLDRAGHLADLRLQPLDAQDEFGGRRLRGVLAGGLAARTCGRAASRRPARRLPSS